MCRENLLSSYAPLVLGQEISSKEKFDTMLPTLFQALSTTLDDECRAHKSRDATLSHPDVFHLVRRCILRAALDVLVTPWLLRRDPSLLTALMSFQDNVEDAIAKAAVLPRFLALPLCLWPMALSRRRLTRRLKRILESVKTEAEAAEAGPWLRAFWSEQVPLQDAAEFVVGLVFAAHKNPAIGAAQSLCFLRSLDVTTQQTAAAEAKRLQASMADGARQKGGVEALLAAATLRQCVLETMRITAHTLGALRYANAPLEIKTRTSNLTIPRGATVAIAHNSTHSDVSVWGSNASEFRLDRPEWTLQSADMSSPVEPYKLTTFSQGVHKCPGEKFAMAVMEMMLALLLLRDSQLHRTPELSFERATLAQRAGPVPVKLQRHVLV